MKRITKLGIGTAFVSALAFMFYTKFTDAPEKYYGFGSYKDYKPVSCSIPTKGDVIEVVKLAGEEYKETRNKDGSIVLTGNFNYEIERDSGFAPNSEGHSDAYGNTPENSDYWNDVREGTVKLEKVVN